MKKKIMIVIISIFLVEAIAIGFYVYKKSNRSVEYLFDNYVKAYEKADDKAIKDIYPPYYVKVAKKYLSKKYLQSSLKVFKERYGDGFKITYEIIKKAKLSDKELKELNKNIATTFKTKDKASKCYRLEGATIFEGSKGKERTLFHNINYCKYKMTWYLVIN